MKKINYFTSLTSKLAGLVVMVSLLCQQVAYSQTASDILRYTDLSPQGTARAAGIGGAVGGLGGDFTALSINPAGIGGFWKSEFMVTPSYMLVNTDAVLEGTTSTERDNNFGISNIGIVFTNTPNRGKWRSVSLGFGLNKMNNYRQEQFFRGETRGSIVDRFAGLGTDLTPDQLDGFEAGPAFDAGAIYDFDSDNIYESDFLGYGDVPFGKQQLASQSGYFNEMAISFGGNLDNKVLLGLTLGIPFVSYTSEKVYRESDEGDVIPAFNELRFEEYLNTDGGGVNLKLGAIAKIGKSLRVGAAFHSPTYLNLTDRFSTELNYVFDQGSGEQSLDGLSPEGEFEYAIITPWRAVGSAAYIFGKYGFVSADVEFVDHGSTRYDFTTNSDNLEDREYQDVVNAEIKDLYGSALNIRLGGELAYEGLRVRGGLQLIGGPYQEDNKTQSIITLGAGVRGNRAYLDVAYNYRTQKELYLPYQVSGAPNQLVNTTTNRSQFLLTLGFKI